MKALILCNGEPPSDEVLVRHLRGSKLIICTDGASRWARKRGVKPHVVIGDMDSNPLRVGRSSKIAETERANVDVRPTRDDDCEVIHCGPHDQQENTDAEKALLLALEREATEIALLGATGQRLDHTLGNVWLVARYHDRAEVVLADEYGELRVISGRHTLNTHSGFRVSLLALTADATLDTEGLKWPLHGALEPGTRGLSNEAVGDEVVVEVHTGMVAVVTA